MSSRTLLCILVAALAVDVVLAEKLTPEQIKCRNAEIAQIKEFRKAYPHLQIMKEEVRDYLIDPIKFPGELVRMIFDELGKDTTVTFAKMKAIVDWKDKFIPYVAPDCKKVPGVTVPASLSRSKSKSGKP